MKNKDSLNIAIIGAGNDAIFLVSVLDECESANIVGLCNPGLDEAGQLAIQDLNIPVFEKLEQLPSIGDVDVIIDATDGSVEIEAVDGLERVGVIRGKSIDVIQKLAAELKMSRDDADDILSIGYELASQKNSESIYHAIVENAVKITGTAAGSLVIFNEKTEICRLAGVSGYSKEISELSWELQPGGITERLLDIDEPLLIQDIKEEPLFDNPVMNEGTTSVLASALKEGDEVIGLLFVSDFKPRQFSESELLRFSAFAAQASLALQKALLIEKNEELATTDTLTGLNNSRHFFSTLEMELNRAKRYGGNFAVVLMDIDNLNAVNDEFGHKKGDAAIKRIADTIVACSRLTDYKARYGGDEFAMILPGTSCSQASVLANRIRRQVNDIFVEADGRELQLSVSIGIAEFPCLGTTADDLMNAVSTALYICKQRGRNLVCCYENSGDSATELP